MPASPTNGRVADTVTAVVVPGVARVAKVVCVDADLLLTSSFPLVAMPKRARMAGPRGDLLFGLEGGRTRRQTEVLGEERIAVGRAHDERVVRARRRVEDREVTVGIGRVGGCADSHRRVRRGEPELVDYGAPHRVGRAHGRCVSTRVFFEAASVVPQPASARNDINTLTRPILARVPRACCVRTEGAAARGKIVLTEPGKNRQTAKILQRLRREGRPIR